MFLNQAQENQNNPALCKRVKYDLFCGGVKHLHKTNTFFASLICTLLYVMEETVMRQFNPWISLIITFLISSFVWLGWLQPATANDINLSPTLAVIDQSATGVESLCADAGQKIDLNNANLLAFTDCPGFYPNLAQLIVQHGPYDQVDDVLKIPDLNDQQKQLLKANLGFFTVSTPVVPSAQRMPPRPPMRANP